MRYVFTETYIALVINLVKCARNCEAIAKVVNCIFKIHFSLYYQYPLLRIMCGNTDT
jgi:hypothetical protein